MILYRSSLHSLQALVVHAGMLWIAMLVPMTAVWPRMSERRHSRRHQRSQVLDQHSNCNIICQGTNPPGLISIRPFLPLSFHEPFAPPHPYGATIPLLFYFPAAGGGPVPACTAAIGLPCRPPVHTLAPDTSPFLGYSTRLTFPRLTITCLTSTSSVQTKGSCKL